jgi:DNA modification methylase
MNLPTQIELRSIRALLPYARNSRTHTEEQIAQIAASIREFGWTNPILVDEDGTIIAGHARLLAARHLGMDRVPVIVLSHLTPAQKRALVIADNKLALNAGWDEEMLRAELASLQEVGFDMDVVGFSDEELHSLLAGRESAVPEEAADVEEAIPDEPLKPVTRPGDVWLIGRHRLICGDCRDWDTLRALLIDRRQPDMAITSPPYATQREYDASSGFKPIRAEDYVEWYSVVAAALKEILAPDGSYFLNIKEHAVDGERHLYVKDLVIAHKRLWGWRFVDEFCWRKTDNGVPGGWNNRFKNAWEPVFHFCKQQEIKFRPKAVGHESEDCFDYSPDNPKSTSGSGLLGTGPRGQAAGMEGADDSAGRFRGIARPSNVIEVKTESSQGSHSAPFPRALVEFFIRAFTDAGDAVFDPFLGSGTTMAAAHVLSRTGYGCEISPAYCDVILRRMMNLGAESPRLEPTGMLFADVAAARGVDPNEALNPKAQDSRAIKHRGAAQYYGARKNAS